MDEGAGCPAYQRAGALGGRTVPKGPSARREGEESVDKVRQYHRRGLHQQTGGTKSPSLCLHTRQLLLSLRATHIPGVDNSLADSLSRGVSLSVTEWALSQAVVSEVFRQLGEPSVDLFATFSNRRLPVFCTRENDVRALAIDAFSLDWTGMAVYAFPPIQVIPNVLQKLTRDVCSMVLIAPCWTRQPWFPTLLSLIVDVPLVLPASPDLLRVPGSQVRFHEVERLHLTAWPLSADVTRRRDFLERLPRLLLGVEGNLPIKSTLQDLSFILNGAGEKRSLQLKHL